MGKHPLQLYSLATPNGQKVTIMLEELLALGLGDAEYDAWLIKFTEGDQFGSGFVTIILAGGEGRCIGGNKPLALLEEQRLLDALEPSRAPSRVTSRPHFASQVNSL